MKTLTSAVSGRLLHTLEHSGTDVSLANQPTPGIISQLVHAYQQITFAMCLHGRNGTSHLMARSRHESVQAQTIVKSHFSRF